MTCSICHKPVTPIDHPFFIGTPRSPSERWTITAPLYFRATPDGREMAKGFCGTECAVMDLRRGM
jgi:hypothetical protein